MLLDAAGNVPAPLTASGHRINILSISGGKDSTAMYLLALEQGVEFLPVFADTGNEHEITLEYVSRLAERTGGPKVQWVKADLRRRVEARKAFIAANYDQERVAGVLLALEAVHEDSSAFLALCLWKGMFPCNVRRFCTIELKVLPIQRYVNAPLLDAGHTVVSWQGIRAEESKDRSKACETEPIGEGVIAYRPLLNWKVQDVFAMHKRHGLAANPLYKLGMSRVGCMPCIMSRKEEISQIARRFPEHIDKIRRWESLVRKVSKKGTPTFFPCTKIPKTHDMRASIDNVVSWAATTRGGKQYDLLKTLPPPACQSEYGLCE